MRRRTAALTALLLAACDGGAPTLDATVDTPAAPDAATLPDAPSTPGDAPAPPDVADASTADAARDAGPVTLGAGQDAWEDLRDEGARVELVMGPQGGWHVYGRVRMRGITPDVFLTFSLTPEAGGAPVNLAHETVRRMERRGLIRVGDVYESSAGELVILAEAVRPPDVVGRRFRFGVRVERPDPKRLRVFVGGDERLVTVVDERP